MSIWRKKRVFKFVNLYIIIVALLICFSLGYYVGQSQKQIDKLTSEINPEMSDFEKGGVVSNKDSVKDYLLKNVDFDTYWDVWKLLQRQYVDRPIRDTELFYGALKGMADSLDDPYTVFLDPETYKTFSDDFAGTFEGIGAEIGIRSGQLVVISPLSDSPAQQAGLFAGDMIIKVDGKETPGMGLDEAVNLIRGEKGTTVVLTVYRKELEEPLDISVVRGIINVKSVKWAILKDEIGHIELSHFNDDTLDLLEEAVIDFKIRDIKKIILDLRNNPGGYLSTSVDVASYWVSKEPVVTERFSDGRERQYKARGKTPLLGMETVVLVNQGSASASEIVAGALQDYDLATVVGKQTYGKGSVQVLEKLEDGSALKITIAKWLTPGGRSINDEGIKPDLEIDLTSEDFDGDKDPQLDKAIEILLNKEIVSKTK